MPEQNQIDNIRFINGDLAADFFTAFSADTPLVWLHTADQGLACRKIRDVLLANSSNTVVVEWDIGRGLRFWTSQTRNSILGELVKSTAPPTMSRPFTEILPDELLSDMSGIHPQGWVSEVLGRVSGVANIVVLARNLDKFLVGNGRNGENDNARLMQIMDNCYEEFSKGLDSTSNAANRLCKMLAVVSPFRDIPNRIARRFFSIDQPLPNFEEVRGCIARLAEDAFAEKSLAPDLLDSASEAAAGLTLSEAENIASQCIVEKGELNPKRIWDLKSKMIEKDGILEIHRADFGFEAIGGLSHLKRFTKTCLSKRRDHNDPAHPLGVILVGVPGSGKSLTAKALGKETGRPTLILDLGRIRDKWVGSSEANLRSVFQTLEATGPCVLFIDEIEKSLGGAGGGDGGSHQVDDQLMGNILTWMSGEKRRDVYIIATANRLDTMNEAFLRAGRFDAVFFVDFPNSIEREAIWEVHRKKYSIPESAEQPESACWTGAEIEQCCRMSSLMGITLADASRMMPLTHKMSEKSIEAMREQARGKYLSASKPGLFTFNSHMMLAEQLEHNHELPPIPATETSAGKKSGGARKLKINKKSN